jgi:DNA ligase-1
MSKQSNFEPMLAVQYSGSINGTKLASPKLDGIRATIQGGVVYSRNGKPIRNRFIQSVLGTPDLDGLDGELIVGSPTSPDAFRVSTSGVMSAEGEPQFTFHVFDHFSDKPFHVRLDTAREIVKDFMDSRVVIVPHVFVINDEQLELYESQLLEEGYEGVMLRCPGGVYKQGRSTVKEGLLLKVKRFVDNEATIIGYVEGEGKLEGMLGKFVCQTEEGVVFGVGSGYSEALRQELWSVRDEMIGQLLKFKHFEVGAKDAPRFPTFIGIRDRSDL